MALIDLVQNAVKDDSGRLTQIDDFVPAIEAALERYSKHRPRELVEDVAGAGTHDVDLPDGWVEEFSEVRQVEYPVGEVPETIIPGYLWKIYRSASGPVLRLLEDTPEATEPVRITYTVLRTEAHVATGDLNAVANLAASICCDTLANLFASTNDPTISADVVNYRSKSSEYGKRAKELRRLYQDHMGIDAEGGAPAWSVVAPPPAGGYGLTHWRR